MVQVLNPRQVRMLGFKPQLGTLVPNLQLQKVKLRRTVHQRQSTLLRDSTASAAAFIT